VLEVVDSPVELQKCAATRNEQRPEAPAQNSRNWTVRFQEPDGPVLSRPTTVRGAAGLRQGAPPPSKRRLDGGEA
jgi:hypothetical protein